MKDIIIVGTGKAALLHYRSYLKIKDRGKIYFVDIINKSKYIEDIIIYHSIKECIEENKLKVNNLIVDICTPKSEFYNVLDICKKLGINDVLVEKPYIYNKKYDSLNLVMVENYLYSKVTQYIKNYIESKHKKINMIYTNFSKNRIIDSSMGRGFNNKVTLNYEIEIPHQLYITNYFLDNYSNCNNLITCSRDMRVGDMHLKNHGYGLIMSKIKDVDVIYESNLTSAIVQKRIIICTDDNYSIEGNYAIYTKSLKLLMKPNVTIYKNGKKEKTKVFNKDDNFTYFITDAYAYFNNKKEMEHKVPIESFSNELSLYCKNLLDRKII